MKNYKFRAWDEELKKMVYQQPKKTEVYSLSAFFNGIQSNNVIMQYSGLNDANGRKIYEGDIVEIYWNSKPRPYIDKLLCKFSNGSFNFFYKSIERVINVDTTTYNIIGNIHEHPHLLNTPIQNS